MKKLFFAAFLFAGTTAFAQKNLKPENQISEAFLKEHLTVIAGPEMEGRETGTEGMRKAAAYIENQFEKWGVKKPAGKESYQQFYSLYSDSLVNSKLIVGSDTAKFGRDYIIPNNRGLAASSFSNGIVFAGYGIDADGYSDYKNLDVKGKTVVLLTGEPKRNDAYFLGENQKMSEWSFPGLDKKFETAMEKGANTVLFVSAFTDSFSTAAVKNSLAGNMYFPRNNNRGREYAQITHAFAAKIFGQDVVQKIQQGRSNKMFATEDYTTVQKPVVYSFLKQRQTTPASNIVGVVEGSDLKNEYVYVTAHYDHVGIINGKIYYGADDDGSGTVGVMAMAKTVAAEKAAGKGPGRTMVFVLFSGEEKGLWGSEFYSDNPLFDLSKTTAALNIDMIGRIDTERAKADTMNYVYVVGQSRLSSDWQGILDRNNKRFKLSLDNKFDLASDPNRIYFRSDHYNFARKGVPVLFFYDGMLKADYHKPTDTVDKITWSLYRKRTLLVYDIAKELANATTGLLKRDIPLTNESR